MAESKQMKNQSPHGYKALNTNTQISTSTASHCHTFESGKSGISRETGLPLGNVTFKVNTRRSAEDEINAITPHDSQHRTESSCSNSLSVNFPFSLQNLAGKNSVYSDNSDNVRLGGNEHENLLTHSGETMILMNHHEGLLREGGENTWNPKCKYESSESSIAKVAEFDLNEDINENGIGDFIHGVIRVVAKTGVLSGQPTIPLEFRGGLGWTGPSKTSAFWPVSTWRSSNREKSQCCFSGFDLNVAAVEDDVMGTVLSCPAVDLKRSVTPSIDLNRIFDVGDEFTPPSLENPHLLDLKLNVINTSRTSGPMKSGYQDFIPIRRDYHLPVSSPMQHFASYGSLQPKFPTLSHPLPHQAYPYKVPLQIGPTQYLGYHPQQHNFLPGLYNPGGPVNPVFGNLLTSGTKADEGSRPFLFLADKLPSGECLQNHDWDLTSKKRKETEGGFECFTSLATNR
ncbi:zinc finger (C2H2 type) family protein [Striga asiatica]|uniref:Zinc finger (C2H2 type) family protein n=1 Tax=Striga asiatica TaxID=4170 RepID=A0A5A7P3Z3_STRAF|nr:zinc finger (C2H2 type) family protein [Striga asiatica]